MQNSAWAALLRHIPSEIHHNLMLVTASGTEIAIQAILRVDHEFMALKGRLAGSQDAGRLFLIAYNQIDYFGFQQPVKESEFHEWFDGLEMPAPAAEPVAEELVAEVEPEPEPVPEAAPAPPATPAAATPPVPEAPPPVSPTSPVVKSAVLERFRARKPISGLRPPIKR